MYFIYVTCAREIESDAEAFVDTYRSRFFLTLTSVVMIHSKHSQRYMDQLEPTKTSPLISMISVV
jgi:hypothetical protein